LVYHNPTRKRGTTAQVPRLRVGLGLMPPTSKKTGNRRSDCQPYTLQEFVYFLLQQADSHASTPAVVLTSVAVSDWQQTPSQQPPASQQQSFGSQASHTQSLHSHATLAATSVTDLELQQPKLQELDLAGWTVPVENAMLLAFMRLLLPA
jgi:hypothetical protein